MSGRKTLMDVTVEGVERAILNMIDCLTPDIIKEAVIRQATLLRNIYRIPQPYRRNVEAILGMIKVLASIYPRPDIDQAMRHILDKLESDPEWSSRLWWFRRMLQHPAVMNWFRMQIEEMIDFVWGDAHA